MTESDYRQIAEINTFYAPYRAHFLKAYARPILPVHTNVNHKLWLRLMGSIETWDLKLND